MFNILFLERATLQSLTCRSNFFVYCSYDNVHFAPMNPCIFKKIGELQTYEFCGKVTTACIVHALILLCQIKDISASSIHVVFDYHYRGFT